MKPGIFEAARSIGDDLATRGEWLSGLQGIVDLLAADHAIIVAHDDAAGQPLMVQSAGIDPVDLARFTSPETGRWMQPFRSAMPNGIAMAWSDLVSDRQFERSALYNEVVRPANGFYAVATRVELPAISIFLAVCRSKQNGDFASRDVMGVQALLPLFTANVELHQRLQASEQRHSGFASVLDRVDTGIILLDAATRPAFVNARAREIAAAKDGLVLNADHLAASAPLDTRALRAAVAAAAAQGGTPLRLRLSRPSRRPPLMVNVMPIPAGSGGSLVAVFVFEPESPPVIDSELLVTAFGLAPREAELAVLLAGGAKLSDVALALGIGIGTARWYLKRVLEKTGTHRQAELTHLIRHGFAGRET